ncbi:MAG: exodeoxyribonuclease VII small subunit [Chlamydiota bacterium]|nr:exodeoxyribonuclease VII small subunit [Chlamydiota bacterium]
MTKKEADISFEKAFTRLEEILEKLNSGSVTLDESLTLYEEADKLITKCGLKLSAAEKSVEKLIKQRNGALSMDAENNPTKEPFSPGNG